MNVAANKEHQLCFWISKSGKGLTILGSDRPHFAQAKLIARILSGCAWCQRRHCICIYNIAARIIANSRISPLSHLHSECDRGKKSTDPRCLSGAIFESVVHLLAECPHMLLRQALPIFIQLTAILIMYIMSSKKNMIAHTTSLSGIARRRVSETTAVQYSTEDTGETLGYEINTPEHMSML